jgi:hypothetical protein
MSRSRVDATLVILAVTSVMAVVGCIVGAIFALVSWEAPAAQRLLGGLITGGVTGLGLGFVMGWHGTSISRSPGRASGAGLWGIVPAGLLGLSLAPPIGAAVGLAFGQFVMAGLFGVIVGPLLGIAAWELAYWADELLERMPAAR